MTPAVKLLTIANVPLFVLQFLARMVSATPFDFHELFGLAPLLIARQLLRWQFVTCMFVCGGVLQVLSSMLAGWMFVRDVEGVWGERKSLQYCFLNCCQGRGVPLSRGPDNRSVTIGISGISGMAHRGGMIFEVFQRRRSIFSLEMLTL